MSKVACAIVGVGGIGIQHGAWAEATGVVEVRAVCDANTELRDKVTDKFPKASFYTDIAEMLASEKLDLAVIASPHHLHAPLTIACLNAGLDVLVEKPMATRYADCLAMIDAARRTGKLLTVFHNRRLDPWYVAARNVVATGRLGHLVDIRASWLNNPGWKKQIVTWRSYNDSSGGLMYDWGSHLIDNVLHFANASVLSVSASLWRRPGVDPAINADHGQIDIRFASGATGRILVSDVDRGPRYRYTLVGDDATLVDEWNWTGGALKIYSGDSRAEFDVEEIAYGTDKGSAPGFYANLAAHYRDGASVLVTAQSAARVIRVLNAADESHSRGGAPVTFEE